MNSGSLPKIALALCLLICPLLVHSTTTAGQQLEGWSGPYATVAGQDVFEGPQPGGSEPDGFGSAFPELGDAFGAGEVAQEISVSASFTRPADGKPARLLVTAKMAPGWHIYSLTQPKGDIKPTTISLAPSSDYELAGEFVADQKPHVRQTEFFPVPLEEHYGTVTFSVPIRFAAGVDPAAARIKGQLVGTVCHDEKGCVPLQPPASEFEATMVATALPDPGRLPPVGSGGEGSGRSLDVLSDPSTSPPDLVGATPFRVRATHVDVTGYIIDPQGLQPGGTFQLVFSFVPDEGWHVYAQDTSGPGSSPTLFVLESPEDWVVGSPIASSEVVEKQLGDEPPIRYHEGPVTWTVPVQIPKSFQPGPTTVSGLIGFQTCSDSQCDRPVAAAFSATVEVDAGVSATAVPLAIGPADASYKKVAQRAEQSSTSLAQGQTSAGDTDTAAGAAPLKFDPSKLAAQEAVQATSLGRALIFAFLGGLILNVMPCVLPVIGLKILSFFDQAGQSRSRAFMLNFWYSLGLLSVFMVLAVLGASLSEMFTERLFGIVMASIVFAMALSLMGVWELQVPSFLGGGQAQALMQKEGVFGAFFKGVITTLLAIPCGAPLLSPALLWTDEQVRAGATHNVFLIFGVIGLGMASPYLIIGAFPELLRFLPKPGAWMDTFKKVMGYGLLVAVIWILYFLPLEDAVPTVAFLFGIWFACWLVGQVPITAADSTKVWTWVSAILVVALSYVVSFQLLVRPFTADKVARLVQAAEPDPLWQPFDRERFDQLVAAEKTIMVDFTADWCFTCKTLEATVLKTDNVRQAIEKNGVVTFMADWTNKDAEVTAMLDALKSRQVPVLAIFPAGNPLEPIVFRGGYTQQNVIDALAEAGPSVGADAVPRTAMRGP